MKFGIYIHIPYCLQICSYCDFAKFEVGKIPDQNHYTQLLIREIRQKSISYSDQTVTSIYFGGGTPSLMTVENFETILSEIRKHFKLSYQPEMTIEINPGNLPEEKFLALKSLGINRYSVGSQTFDDNLLKLVGRKHDAQETRDTLDLLNKYDVNFSMDLLFALPHQTLSGLKKDLDISLSYQPKHVSTYYLNIPVNHKLSQNRPSDSHQVEMFDLIEDSLEKNGLQRYEISNFAKNGFESQHNTIYWNDLPYLGFGLSAHSYVIPKDKPFGVRMWNPKSYEGYEKSLDDGLSDDNIENLQEHESMTEFCYTSLRKMSGLDLDLFQKKYNKIPKLLVSELNSLISRDLLQKNPSNPNVYQLTKGGKILSNLVFERLTFLKEDLY